jgi:tetraacyldisaccharide 4'-kinase
MVLWIAERLSREGKHAAILTRGYRGVPDVKSNGAQGVPQSDEVALLRDRLAGKVQLGVGVNRYKNGEALARHGVDWFVLDDGFQHLKLARDVDIVLLDATDPFGGGATFPSGRLREPFSGLRRADIVVITRSVQAPAPALEAIIRRHTGCPIFYATTELISVLRIPRLDLALPEQEWRRARYVAFCGIGNSSAFFQDLGSWGFHVVGERSFADHHVYSAQESSELERLALSCGADALLCTEKDVWNLRHVQFAGMPVHCCRISFQLPETFWETITQVLGRKQVGAAR